MALSPSIASSLGQYGAQVQTGATALVPDAGFAFGCIQFVTSGQLSAITARGWSGSAITGVSFAADSKIYGLFTSVTPAAGVTIIGYKIPFKP
jgi:hypothetical protein